MRVVCFQDETWQILMAISGHYIQTGHLQGAVQVMCDQSRGEGVLTFAHGGEGGGGINRLRYPWDAWKFKLPRIPRFYFAKIPWDGWKFKLPRIPRFFGKIKPWPSWKFELPRWSRFYFAKKPWDAWKFKLPPIPRFYFAIKPWDAWKFKLPPIPRYFGKIKPWDAWKFHPVESNMIPSISSK